MLSKYGETKCANCGKTFKKQYENHLCCSLQCANIWKNRNNHKKFICEICGKEYKVPNSVLKYW